MLSDNIQFRMYEASVLLIRSLAICLISLFPFQGTSSRADAIDGVVKVICEYEEITFQPLNILSSERSLSSEFGLSKCPLDLLVSLGRQKAPRHMSVRDFLWINGIGRKLSVRAYSSRHLKSWSAFAHAARFSRAQLTAVRKWVYIND